MSEGARLSRERIKKPPVPADNGDGSVQVGVIATVSESKVAQSVQAELTNPAGNGGRHSQMRSTILSLLEIGLSARAIFVQFREMYDDDVLDSEIEAIIQWGLARIRKSPETSQSRPRSVLTASEAIAKATAWLDGFEIHEADLWHASLIRPGDDDPPSHDSILLLEHLYRAHELVTINIRYLVDPKNKVTIVGPGETKTAGEWVNRVRAHGTPESRAGAWIRLNPMRAVQGSGSGGAHCDADVAAWRYLLVESDLLPPELALNVYGKLALPIAAVIDTAGRGPHAWVTLNARSPEEYARKANNILSQLATMGFDPANSNPSRYGRLAGASRIIGAREGVSNQQLLYLAPGLRPGGIFHERL